jgi:hypothetical protein
MRNTGLKRRVLSSGAMIKSHQGRPVPSTMTQSLPQSECARQGHRNEAMLFIALMSLQSPHVFIDLMSLQIPQKVCIRIVRTFKCQDRVGIAMPNKISKGCRMYSTERAQTSENLSISFLNKVLKMSATFPSESNPVRSAWHPPHNTGLDLTLTYENDLDTQN